MTRLERAALDYAIAYLTYAHHTHGSRLPGGPFELRDAYRCANQAFDDGVPGRIVVARLALYLRLLRRVDAWESRQWSEWPDWTCPRMQAEPVGMWLDAGKVQYETWFGGHLDGYRLKPWHPLWLDAPAYDPSITPRMRRRASCVSL